MVDWRAAIAQVASSVEEHFDALKFRLEQRLALLQPMQIVPYIGHGIRQRLHVKGRVLRNRGITSAKDSDTVWKNLLNMYKRFESDEVRFARVRARFGATAQEVVANEEGFFDVHILLDEPLLTNNVWHEVTLELVEPAEQTPVRATARVIVPPPDAEFGVISDIDDTVIRTDALDLLAMARNIYLHNAHTRLPFEGVAALYRALQAGTQGGYNPIYYVSSSPWNLYDLLIDFFDIRGIPLGPLFLADWGFSTDTLLTPAHRVHKLPAIQNLLETHPRLPFLLIGDSGQQDPEIYLEVARRNPGRIPVVYIRDVTSAKRDAEVHAIAEEVRRAGSEMVLVKDSAAAAEHAAARGLIVPQAEPQVKEERDEDRKAPTPLEQLLSAAG